MRHAQESARERSPLISRSLVLAAVGLLCIGGTARAETIGTPLAVEPADTSRTGNPVHFRKTVLFTPEYLARAAEAASQRRTEREAAAAREATDETVAGFARRYGISRDLARKIHDTALAERIDPDLAFRLVYAESRFNPRARGPAGALGLAQLMPSTARALDRSLRTEADILDPATNLRLGFGYLRRLIERYDGDVRLGLLAYNRGQGTVDRVLRSGRDPENGYSRKVLGTRAGAAYTGLGVLER